MTVHASEALDIELWGGRRLKHLDACLYCIYSSNLGLIVYLGMRIPISGS